MVLKDDRPVRAERTGWRDWRISLRHKCWGFDCPAVDIDFPMIEYDRGRCMAFVEYKHECSAMLSKEEIEKNRSFQAMTHLGNQAQVPVLLVKYANDFSWFRVFPLNYVAKFFIPKCAEMGEREYVELLYKMRHSTAPRETLDSIEVTWEKLLAAYRRLQSPEVKPEWVY
jgi:hypothetical protein